MAFTRRRTVRLISVLMGNMRACAIAAPRVRAGSLFKLNGGMGNIKLAVQPLAQIRHHILLSLRLRHMQNDVRAECDVL